MFKTNIKKNIYKEVGAPRAKFGPISEMHHIFLNICYGCLFHENKTELSREVIFGRKYDEEVESIPAQEC
jgi:hypothetical protein